jgi:hypothetical protein
MSLPLVLLAMAAPIGALDMLYFHIWKYRLFASADSRVETLTHIVRGLTVALLAWMLGHYRPEGAWFWIVGSLFAIDLLNSLVDVAIEPRSRAAWGGVPSAEAVIHNVGTSFLGAIAALYVSSGWQGRLLPTALSPSDLPNYLVLQAELIAGGGLILAVTELGLLICAWSGRCRNSAQPEVASIT